MKITNQKELDEAIAQLEKRRDEQYDAVRDRYNKTMKSLQPSHLIQGAFKNLIHTGEGRSGLLKTAAGVGLGILTRQFLWGKSSSVAKRWLGNALKIGMTKAAVSNSDKLKAYGMALYNNLFRKQRHADKE